MNAIQIELKRHHQQRQQWQHTQRERKKSWNHKRINRLWIFSIWFSFSLVSRFKRDPSWQYRNKCQNLIWIYWIKQFQRKMWNNRIYGTFFLFIHRNIVSGVWAHTIKANKIKRNYCYFQLSREPVHVYSSRCRMTLFWVLLVCSNIESCTTKCVHFSVFLFSLFSLPNTQHGRDEEIIFLALKMCICNKCVWLSLFFVIQFFSHTSKAK